MIVSHRIYLFTL